MFKTLLFVFGVLAVASAQYIASPYIASPLYRTYSGYNTYGAGYLPYAYSYPYSSLGYGYNYNYLYK